MSAASAALPGFRSRLLLGTVLALLAAALLLSRLHQREQPDAPLLVLGLLSDAQYADTADGLSAWGIARHYRASLGIAQAAAKAFSSARAQAVVHLGDAIDGKAQSGPGGSVSALAALQAALSSAGAPVHYLLGNHGFYNLPRGELATLYGIAPSPQAAATGAHFAATTLGGVRLLFLDSYAVSVIGHAAGTPQHTAAAAALAAARAAARPPDAPQPRTENDPAGLTRLHRRWVALNGGLGAAQLAWLDGELSAAAAVGQRALILSHVPLHPRATSSWCRAMCLAWDYEAALAVIRRHAATVGACLAGHDHFGGFARDGASGVRFITLQGVIETKPGDVAYGVLELRPRQLRLRGVGRLRSRRFRLPPLPQAEGMR